MNLPSFFNRLFQLGWRGVSVSANHRGEVDLIELTRAGEVVDTYTAAELEAGATLGLYEQMHAQAIRMGLCVTLVSDPKRHPDYQHAVTVTGRWQVTGEGADPLSALLRALLDYQLRASRPTFRQRLTRWAS